MAFHVEIRRSFHRAAAFNLDANQLRPLLERWSSGAEIELGDHRWQPAKSELTVLEGRELAPAELSFGQGWQNATRSARDVTAEALSESRAPHGGAVAVLAASEASARALSSLLESIGLVPVPWSAVRAALLQRASPQPQPNAAVVVLPQDGELSADSAFDYGLAIGSLGPRAIVVGPADTPLSHLAPLDISGASGRAAFVERLRLAGCEPQVSPSSI